MSNKSTLEKLFEKKLAYRYKAIASVAVCALGAISMHISDGNTGVGWSILGLMFIWG